MNGTQNRLMLTVVVDRLSDRPYAAGDACIRDRPPMPDFFGNLVLGHHAIAVTNQMDQK
jgi:hypothetical protein